jgi:alkanesulfonate monooxygenase SsuD/methylene tetrahydromethanopterin reductase-like flavin-dependent oxidoreductase (luciferase family)
MSALAIYRERFKPSEQLRKPYAMVALNVFAAETDAEAKRLFTSAQQRALGIIQGDRGLLPPPVDSMDGLWQPVDKARVERMLACSVVGSRQTVREGLERFIAQTQADEYIVATAIHDHSARVRSYQILDEVIRDAGLGDGAI